MCAIPAVECWMDFFNGAVNLPSIFAGAVRQCLRQRTRKGLGALHTCGRETCISPAHDCASALARVS